MIRAWRRKDHETGDVRVVSRGYVLAQLLRESALSRAEAERLMISNSNGRPITLAHATYYFGGPA